MPKQPSEETKKLVQTKLSFAPRTIVSAPPTSPPVPPSNRYPSSVSSPASSSSRFLPPGSSSAQSSSRYFSNSSSSGSSQRRSAAGPGALFKNRQWVRQDSGGSSSLSGLSLSDKGGDKKGRSEGLDGREESPKRLKPYTNRYNMELAAVAKETM